MLESQLQIRLINELEEIENIYYYSIPNESKRSYNQAKKLKSMGMRTGTPDIHITKKGISIFVEMKAEGQKLRPSQQECKELILLAGARHYTLDSIESIDKFIKYLKGL